MSNEWSSAAQVETRLDGIEVSGKWTFGENIEVVTLRLMSYPEDAHEAWLDRDAWERLKAAIDQAFESEASR